MFQIGNRQDAVITTTEGLFANWANNEPQSGGGGDFGSLMLDSGAWNSNDEHKELLYVCEQSTL